MRLKPRIEALERRNPELKPWLHVIQDEGQTQEEAVAAYEAENGPIGDANLILRVIVSPEGKELQCA